MEWVPPQEIASRFFKRFVIVCICCILAGFALRPLFLTHASGNMTISRSSNARSNIAAYLNANGFRLTGTSQNPDNADIYKGRYEASFPFEISVSEPRNSAHIFTVSISYRFFGFNSKVNDSENKVRDFETSLNAWLEKFNS